MWPSYSFQNQPHLHLTLTPFVSLMDLQIMTIPPVGLLGGAKINLVNSQPSPPKLIQLILTELKLCPGKNGSYQAILREVELPIIPRSTCQTALRKTNLGSTFNLHESFLCAGGLKGLDTCVVSLFTYNLLLNNKLYK